MCNYHHFLETTTTLSAAVAAAAVIAAVAAVVEGLVTSGTRPRKRNRKGSSVVGIAAATLVVIAKSAFFRFCLSCSMPSTFGTYMFGPSLYVYAYNKVFQSLARNPSPPCALGHITYDAISFAGIHSTAAASVRFSRHCAQRTASRGRGLRLALTAAFMKLRVQKRPHLALMALQTLMLQPTRHLFCNADCSHPSAGH